MRHPPDFFVRPPVDSSYSHICGLFSPAVGNLMQALGTRNFRAFLEESVAHVLPVFVAGSKAGAVEQLATLCDRFEVCCTCRELDDVVTASRLSGFCRGHGWICGSNHTCTSHASAQACTIKYVSRNWPSTVAGFQTSTPTTCTAGWTGKTPALRLVPIWLFYGECGRTNAACIDTALHIHALATGTRNLILSFKSRLVGKDGMIGRWELPKFHQQRYLRPGDCAS